MAACRRSPGSVGYPDDVPRLHIPLLIHAPLHNDLRIEGVWVERIICLDKYNDYSSIIYPIIKELGYGIEVMSYREFSQNNKLVDNENVFSHLSDDNIFVLTKKGKKISYLDPYDYYLFEDFVITAINGYLNKLVTKGKKTYGEVLPENPDLLNSKEKLLYKLKMIKDIVSRCEKIIAEKEQQNINDDGGINSETTK